MIAFGTSMKENEIELMIGEKGCVANPGRAFDLPNGVKRGSQEALNLYGGNEKFGIEQIEAYQVIFEWHQLI